jgi:hypothetical protein
MIAKYRIVCWVYRSLKTEELSGDDSQHRESKRCALVREKSTFVGCICCKEKSIVLVQLFPTRVCDKESDRNQTYRGDLDNPREERVIGYNASTNFSGHRVLVWVLQHWTRLSCRSRLGSRLCLRVHVAQVRVQLLLAHRHLQWSADGLMYLLRFRTEQMSTFYFVSRTISRVV